MDRLFDRLGDLLRFLTGADRGDRTGYDERDPDVRAALEELDAWLESGGGPGPRGPGSGHRDAFGPDPEGRPGRGRQAGGQGSRPGPEPAGELRRHYANLEVPFAAPLEQVQGSYRRLLRQYHPDRFSRDPEKLRLATEITKRLNESFQSIRRHYPRGHGPG